MKNRRKPPRAQVELDVKLTVGGSVRHHKTRDIGLGGAFIDRGNHPALDVGVNVELVFPGLHAFSASVVRTDESGTALIFNSLSREDFEFLSALLYPRAA